MLQTIFFWTLIARNISRRFDRHGATTASAAKTNGTAFGRYGNSVQAALVPGVVVDSPMGWAPVSPVGVDEVKLCEATWDNERPALSPEQEEQVPSQTEISIPAEPFHNNY